jgi:hypothetical protein
MKPNLLVEKVIAAQPVNKLFAPNRIRRSITALMRARK